MTWLGRLLGLSILTGSLLAGWVLMEYRDFVATPLRIASRRSGQSSRKISINSGRVSPTTVADRSLMMPAFSRAMCASARVSFGKQEPP